LLWLLLAMFVVWSCFTIYAIARACVQLYLLGSILPFVPSMILGLVSLFFAGWALYMVAIVAFWKIDGLIRKTDAAFRQAELQKRRISLEDRS
jgi:hypothetical protein